MILPVGQLTNGLAECITAGMDSLRERLSVISTDYTHALQGLCFWVIKTTEEPYLQYQVSINGNNYDDAQIYILSFSINEDEAINGNFFDYYNQKPVLGSRLAQVSQCNAEYVAHCMGEVFLRLFRDYYGEYF